MKFSHRFGGDRGQASVEHVGLVALLAVLLAALTAIGPLTGVGEALASAIAGAFTPGGTPEPARLDPRTIVDARLEEDLAAFLAYRDSPERDPRLDYSTDGCSAPLVGSSGASFDFYQACLRHDFGYRNYDRLGIFAERRSAVDERFLADMRDHCGARPASDRGRCFAWARLFYEAVRNFGGLTGHG